MRPDPAVLLSLLGALLLPCLPAHAQQPDWPRLEAPTDVAECRDALALADATFTSPAESVSEPHALPPGSASTPVMHPVEPGVPGFIQVEPGTFDTLIQDAGPLSVYWQRQPASGYRVVVKETYNGWQERYAVYAVDRGMSFGAFMATTTPGQDSASPAIVIDVGSQPPRLYKRHADGQLWTLDVSTDNTALGAWDVYVPDATGLRKACTIRFRPDATQMVDLLPVPVRRLATLLDRAIGNGSDKWRGVYIGLVRKTAKLYWANAALRPWAALTPYNSATQVNHELAQWAHQAAGNRRLLHDIRRQYPLALRALARYYQEQFGLAPESARAQARYILDAAYRGHFVFSGRSLGDNVANPWRWHKPG
jgi:hypothetical protein